MSEYQYYEFAAIDQPLTDGEMAAPRAVSTRAAITPSGFVNHYEWGGLKADPSDWMRCYFDAFSYLADWAHCRFALRLPRDIFGKAELKPFGVKRGLTIDASDDHWILDWSLEDSENYDRFAEDDGRGWMGRLVPLRDELIRGDQRSLYLGWPPVPPRASVQPTPSALNTDQKAALFRRLFRGRTDLYPVRWESEAGKTGYAPACANEWRAGICEKPRIKCSDCGQRSLIALTDRTIFDHLAGRHTTGVYPLLTDDTCNFLAVDFDDAEWREDAKGFAQSCRELGVPDALEVSRSGEGAHAWVFFSTNVGEIVDAYLQGRKVLVLTERTEHLAAIGAALSGRVQNLVTLQGRSSKKQRAAVLATLEALAPDAPRVLLSTGKLVGEGFDHPPLDTLILAMHEGRDNLAATIARCQRHRDENSKPQTEWGRSPLDLKALQTTLREFAAEREWQPFHTPKNLAMALMVEAAELAEIFQWMTPEQSQAARSDLVLQERVADEVADVLLYLVQIADHTGIDLKRAVGRKLVKNSKKHAPVRPGLPLGTAASGGIETHVLVDWENVQPKDDDIRSLVPDVTDIWLFHGPNQKGVGAKHASFGDKATPVKIARTGKNALDFHLSFYMGYIAARHPDARFVVVSNDKGYAPMLEHAAELGFAARQVGFGNGGVVVAKAASKSPAKKAAPAKKATAKKVAAKKMPAKPAAKKAGASKPSAETPKAPTKKAPVAKKTAATKTAVSSVAEAHVASPSATSIASSAVKGNSAIDLSKAVSHVVASLKKTASKPAKRAKLVAAIKSLLGQSADDQAVDSVLTQLLASGKVVIDAKGAVRYELQAD